jgi:DNA-binding NarL/FixJ family response regulator
MARDIGKLASEFWAMDTFDEAVHQGRTGGEYALPGLIARALRRREILTEVKAWMSDAEDSIERINADLCSRHPEIADLLRHGLTARQGNRNTEPS